MSRSSRKPLVTFIALLTASSSLAAETGPALAVILDVCESTTLDEAAVRGGHLGWPIAPEDRNWRTAFERHNGGSVRVVGWRQGAREGDGLLSYWVASGPNAHVACAFLTDQPGLQEALRDRYGAPDTFDEQGDIVSAFWRRGDRDVSFTRVGTSSALNVSRRD